MYSYIREDLSFEIRSDMGFYRNRLIYNLLNIITDIHPIIAKIRKSQTKGLKLEVGFLGSIRLVSESYYISKIKCFLHDEKEERIGQKEL